MSKITYSIEDGLATIVVNNPSQNRYTFAMADELFDVLLAIGRSDARAILYRAEGPDFSLGADVPMFVDTPKEDMRVLLDRYLAAANLLEEIRLPTIALVQGRAFGGGCEMALMCDIIFAADDAQFGHLEAIVGINTLLGGVYRMAQRIGKGRALEMAYTAGAYPAETMEKWGAVNRTFPPDKLLEEGTAFAKKIAAGATKAHSAHKAVVRAWIAGGIPAADQVLIDIVMPVFETEDAKLALSQTTAAYKEGKARPVFKYIGK